MATQQPAQTTSLQDEIKRLEQQLAEKTALLNKQQEEKINSLINAFIADVEKMDLVRLKSKNWLLKNLRVSTRHVSNFFFFLKQKGHFVPFFIEP